MPMVLWLLHSVRHSKVASVGDYEGSWLLGALNDSSTHNDLPCQNPPKLLASHADDTVPLKDQILCRPPHTSY